MLVLRSFTIRSEIWPKSALRATQAYPPCQMQPQRRPKTRPASPEAQAPAIASAESLATATLRQLLPSGKLEATALEGYRGLTPCEPSLPPCLGQEYTERACPREHTAAWLPVHRETSSTRRDMSRWRRATNSAKLSATRWPRVSMSGLVASASASPNFSMIAWRMASIVARTAPSSFTVVIDAAGSTSTVGNSGSVARRRIRANRRTVSASSRVGVGSRYV